jgi:hypothetical protein
MSSSAEPGAIRTLEQRVFDVWPPSLRALLDGTALASKIGFTASLMTCDAGGHVRTSLLGIGELYAPDSRCLAFALWPASRAARTLSHAGHRQLEEARDARPVGPADAPATRNGDRRARAAIAFVHDGAFYQVQLLVAPLCDADANADEGAPTATGLAQFIASIDAGEVQQVGYARLTNGIAFELSGLTPERQAVIDRWETQIERLRQAAHARLAAT